MTTKQKCEKLAKVLEVVATKLKDESIGVAVWERESPTMIALGANLQIFLKAAIDVASAENKKADDAKNSENLDDWPEFIK